MRSPKSLQIPVVVSPSDYSGWPPDQLDLAHLLFRMHLNIMVTMAMTNSHVLPDIAYAHFKHCVSGHCVKVGSHRTWLMISGALARRFAPMYMLAPTAYTALGHTVCTAVQMVAAQQECSALWTK